MIYIAFGLIGAGIGGMKARKQGGNRKDMAQYAAGFGIAFALLGFVATVLIDRWFIAGAS